MYVQLIIRILILGACILNGIISFSQESNTNSAERDYQKFQGTLKKETDKDLQDNLSKNQILHPVQLPNWFLTIPQSDHNYLYSFGISDPGLDEESAHKQAIIRAKALTALTSHPKITSITDNYSGEEVAKGNDKFTTKYENLYRIESKIFASESQFEQMEYYYNSFGEAMVLMRYEISSKPETFDTINVSAEFYQVERQKNTVFETEEKFSLDPSFTESGIPAVLKGNTYSIHSLNNLVEINSIFEGQAIYFPYANYRYEGLDSTLFQEPETELNQKLNFGIWKAYFETLIHKIIGLSLSSSVAIKQVGDEYSNENKILSREISESNPSFGITGIRVDNNYLMLDVVFISKNN
jgi:hypothetical protein